MEPNNEIKKILDSIDEDSKYMKRRRIELQKCIQPYIDWLIHIENIMPIKYKLKINNDGVSDPLSMERIIEPEWQQLIDKAEQSMNDFIKTEFPEFKQ